MARCPCHHDSDPSLSIRDITNGRVLAYCHAGCKQAHTINALRSRNLWPNSSPRRIRIMRTAHLSVNLDTSDYHKPRRTRASRIWRSALPGGGTLTEVYLRSRNITLPVPPTLRFHHCLKHPSGGTWPAMVGLVTQGIDGRPTGVHRTFLRHDGKGKAPTNPQKMMLGRCRGGGVQLSAPDHLLMVGEGIETCLAAMLVTGNPTWAALSAPGMCTLGLPATVREVIVLADGDAPGEAAARDCAWRWKREGRCVRIARPPWGMDFNDLLMGRSPLLSGART
jgi:putative DNA primase/helicase